MRERERERESTQERDGKGRGREQSNSIICYLKHVINPQRHVNLIDASHVNQMN